MPENKYLWRAQVRGVSPPIYLIAQNVPSAVAKLHEAETVSPADMRRILRIGLWDEQKQMTVVDWPEPEPEPKPEPEPPE